MDKVVIYYWADGDYWTNEQLEEISNSFQPNKVKSDIKAAIGAGASGLYPEFNLLLLLSFSIIAHGFLSAMGEDVWKAVKRGVKKILKTKPVKIPEDLPEEYRKYELDLIWWIQSEDASFMVFIKSDSEQEVNFALELLPQVIDIALASNKKFSRIAWNGKSWDLY